ncbi:unnamed protein product, partial [Lampetra planeri]
RPRGIRLHEAPRGSWAAAAEKADEAKRFRDLPGACTEPPGATVSRCRQLQPVAVMKGGVLAAKSTAKAGS